MYYTLDNTLPPMDSICFVELADYNMKSNDLGVYVKLIDYDMRDGFIPLTEISKWKTNISKIFRHGKIYPCLIFSYDTNIINLSFMKIKEEKREPLLEQFMFAQKIKEIYKFLEDNKFEVKSVLDPSMYDDLSVKTLYYNILESPEKYFEKETCELVKTKIKTEFSEGQKEFKLIICQDNGLNKLKESLQLFSSYLQKYISENLEIKIECISSPIYSMKLKFINLEDNFFTNIFSDFERILQENNIKAIIDELELKTHKDKKLMFVA
jgi:translation initiation factor 2 alpha subunit (eIF-2alpha)